MRWNLKHILAAGGLCLVFGVSPVRADMAGIEMAVIKTDYTRAQDLAEAHIDKHPSAAQNREARYYLGLSYLQMGDYQLAREIFEELIEESGENPVKEKAYLGLIDAAFFAGEYLEADKVFREAMSRYPRSDFASLFCLKGARANLKLARWRAAEDLLQKVTGRFPLSPEAPVARQFLREEQYFAVQVGAFLTRQRAEKLVSELKKQEKYAYLVETTDPQGRTFYRVRVGKLGMLKEAEDLKERLSRQGYPAQIYP